MTITINLKQNTKTVKFGDYGTFTVRPMGAGEELELTRLQREMAEMGENLQNMDEYKEAEKNGDKEKVAEGMAKLREMTAKAQEAKAKQIEIFKACVTAKDQASVDRLFNENSLEDLAKAIRGALDA